MTACPGCWANGDTKCAVRKKIFCTHLTEQTRQDKNLLFWHDEPNEPTKERPFNLYPTAKKKCRKLKANIPRKVEYRGLSPNFHIHVSVSELYFPTMELPFLLEEICGPILGIHKSLTDT